MAEYICERNIVSGSYDIENPNRLDGESSQIHLAKEIEALFPGNGFKLVCEDTEAKFIFESALSSGEQSTLLNAVMAHKNNT